MTLFLRSSVIVLVLFLVLTELAANIIINGDFSDTINGGTKCYEYQMPVSWSGGITY